MTRQIHIAVVADIDEHGQIELCNVMSDVSCAQAFDIVLELHRKAKDEPQFKAEADRFVFTFADHAGIHFITPMKPKEPEELLREQPLVNKKDIDEISGPPG